jgi:hypothetical protein
VKVWLAMRFDPGCDPEPELIALATSEEIAQALALDFECRIARDGAVDRVTRYYSFDERTVQHHAPCDCDCGGCDE